MSDHEEEEELYLEDDGDIFLGDEEDDEGDQNEEILASFLTTDDGDNIATVLETALNGINKSIQIQNQILVKILTQISTVKKNNSNNE
jgi:hypothetical protein